MRQAAREAASRQLAAVTVRRYPCDNTAERNGREMSGIEHAYGYRSTSTVADEKDARYLRLATSGGSDPSPYFFRGWLTSPRRTAEMLLAVAEVASTRFFVPGAMLARILRNADPVVTSGGERLRFESFSVCCGVYARCDLRREAVEGDWTGRGTTNVDFNPPMRAALAGLLDSKRVGLNVGVDAVELEHDGGSVVERRVKLPARWLKGFVEVQSYQAGMEPAFELTAVEAQRFFDGLPREVPMSGPPAYLAPFGKTLRLSQRPAAGAVQVGGPARLRVLAKLGRGARALRVYRHEEGASGWELVFDDSRFHLVLSPEASRGFSGEGQALRTLASGKANDALSRVRAALRWQARLEPDALARETGVDAASVSAALAALGARGLVGFDLDERAWFHREMPFDLNAVEELQPRLIDARELVADGGTRVATRDGNRGEVWVRGTEVEHRVRVDGEDDHCTCPWFSRHQGARGPCKHILAARIALGAGDPA